MRKLAISMALASLLVGSAPAMAGSSRANCVGATVSTFGPMAVLEAIMAFGGRFFGEVASTNCDIDSE